MPPELSRVKNALPVISFTVSRASVSKVLKRPSCCTAISRNFSRSTLFAKSASAARAGPLLTNTQQTAKNSVYALPVMLNMAHLRLLGDSALRAAGLGGDEGRLFATPDDHRLEVECVDHPGNRDAHAGQHEVHALAVSDAQNRISLDVRVPHRLKKPFVALLRGVIGAYDDIVAAPLALFLEADLTHIIRRPIAAGVRLQHEA